MTELHWNATELNALSERVIGVCIDVHRTLGPGLLESAYEQCVCHGLEQEGLQFKRQQPLAVEYRGLRMDCAYRVDLIVEGLVILELKAVEQVLRVHEAQLMTYLKLSGLPLGLLINFCVPMLKEGITRRKNGHW